MAKKIVGQLKLHVKAQQANPSPPVGPALGQRGLNIMAFVKEFNARSAEFEPGAPIPVTVTYYQDKSFSMELRSPPASYLLKKAAGLKPEGKRSKMQGSPTPGRKVQGSVTAAQLRQIAEMKMKDLSAVDIDAAMQIILGSAKSCGIEVKG